MQRSVMLASATAFAALLLAGTANSGDLGPPPPGPIVDTVSYRCLRWNEKCEWRWGVATQRYFRCMWRHGCAR